MNSCLTEHLRSFFKSHRSTLQEKHPGLRPHRLQNEIEDQSPCSLDKLEDIFKQLLQGVPLAHIFNNTYFYRSHLWINPHVFIPRFETELLVDLALFKLASGSKDKIYMADVGVGTGAVFLSLLRDCAKAFEVFAIDICSKAIDTAKVNTYRLEYSFHPKSTVKFIQTDRLNNINTRLDLIISNPPYLKKREDTARVHPQVQKFEPTSAVFLADEDYISWYETFFSQAYTLLGPKGFLLIEGDEKYLMGLKNLAKRQGFMAVAIYRDYNNENRFLAAHKENEMESYG